MLGFGHISLYIRSELLKGLSVQPASSISQKLTPYDETAPGFKYADVYKSKIMNSVILCITSHLISVSFLEFFIV